jgi:hypothetical protein
VWTESLFRFFIGGIVISVFSLAGGLVKPTSFAGLFSAAPSVALATLGLTIAKEGHSYASVECRSMMAGSAALWLYSMVTSRLLMRYRFSALAATAISMLAWFGCAFVLWFALLR